MKNKIIKLAEHWKGVANDFRQCAIRISNKKESRELIVKAATYDVCSRELLIILEEIE